MDQQPLVTALKQKAHWVFEKTLSIHRVAQETRVASSLSCIEIFSVLFYGNLIKYFPDCPLHPDRDRFIISKGHGSISFYPILADLGFFSIDELDRAGQEGSFLGGIPDPVIPGYETVNGSLGHGLGVGCGVSLSLKLKDKSQNVIILTGDGELNEGSNWEAIMFAAHHGLDNLLLIVDDNHISMLDYSRKILNISPLSEKFRVFGWDSSDVDGHDIEALYTLLSKKLAERSGKPKVVVANTIKGRGVPSLENRALSHIMNIRPQEIDEILGGK